MRYRSVLSNSYDIFHILGCNHGEKYASPWRQRLHFSRKYFKNILRLLSFQMWQYSYEKKNCKKCLNIYIFKNIVPLESLYKYIWHISSILFSIVRIFRDCFKYLGLIILSSRTSSKSWENFENIHWRGLPLRLSGSSVLGLASWQHGLPAA